MKLTRAAFLTLVAVLLTWQSEPARGFEPAPLQLDETFEHVDALVVAEIRSGAIATLSCGASYTVTIASVLKGNLEAGDSVTLAGRREYKIGATYLMFLTKEDRSINFIDRHANDSDRKNKCQRELQPDFYMGLQTGGLFEIAGTVASERLVLLPRLAFDLPPEIYKDELRGEQTYWTVRLKDIEKRFKAAAP